MYIWLSTIFKKIVCQGTLRELVEVYQAAKKAGLPCSIIEDSGRTEFKGVRTLTAVAIGPAMPEDIDPITGHLNLL